MVALARYEKERPALRDMVQSFLGIKPRTEAANRTDENDTGSLALVPGAVEGTLRKPIPEGLCPWRKTTT